MMREPDDANALPVDSESYPSRYVGAVREYFYGDVERASALRGLALTYLGYLRDQLATGWRANGARRIVLSDSSTIEVIWDGVINTIRVYSPVALAAEELKVQFPYLSGLQEIAVVEAPLFGEYKFASQFYPAWQVPNGREKQWYQYNVNFDSPPFEWAETPTDLATINDDPDVGFIHEWVKTTLPAIDAGSSGLKRFPLWPGMYTGKMRFVVQKLLGRKQTSPFSYNSGLWTPDESTPIDQRQRWVIEISPSTGVTAYPIYFENEFSTLNDKAINISDLTEEERERYDYLLRDGFRVPTLISSNPAYAFGDEDGVVHRYRLADANRITEISEGKGTLTTWYSNWAFSYSGHEAQIVFIGGREYSVNPAVAYSQRYKISFSQASILLPRGRVFYPIIDSIEELEGDYIYTNEFNFELFAPIDSPYQEQIYFDTLGIFPEPRDAPIYVFYTRDDKEVVLRRKDVAISSVNETEQVGIDCTTVGCTVPCVYCDQPYRGGSSMCADAGCQRYTPTAELCEQGFIENRNGSSSTATYYCERTFPAVTDFSGNVYGTYRWVDWQEASSPANNVVCNLLFYDYVVVTEWSRSVGYQLVTGEHNEIRTSRQIIVLPLYDREGFFTMKVEEKKYSGTFLHTNSVDNNIRRTSRIKGPYKDMPEVGATAPYAFPGYYYPVSNVTIRPDDEVNRTYVYVGSVAPDSYGAEDSVITLDLPPEGTVFSDGMTAIAAVEMFSGRAVLAPHPATVLDDEGEQQANLWVASISEGGDEISAYPAAEAYRSRNRLSPKYFCFIGDGNIFAKAGMDVDLNAIPYLAEEPDE